VGRSIHRKSRKKFTALDRPLKPADFHYDLVCHTVCIESGGKETVMARIEGTAARQLDLLDDVAEPEYRPRRPETVRPTLRLLRKDVYAELARRRRRAQIAARHELDKT